LGLKKLREQKAMVFLITYDLTTPNDTSSDYERVIDKIKTLSSAWCHIEKSVWLVDSALNAQEIRDEIKNCLYQSDILFIARLQGNWASWAFGAERNDWLKQRTF
jgi:hypothetical protein